MSASTQSLGCLRSCLARPLTFARFQFALNALADHSESVLARLTRRVEAFDHLAGQRKR